MKMFHRQPEQIEKALAPTPEPQPAALSAAIAEEDAASHAVSAASVRCVELDMEQRTWEVRRTLAYTAFVDALARHKLAKEKIVLTGTADVSGTMTASGAVTVGGSNG